MLPATSTTVRAACPHDCPDTCVMAVAVANFGGGACFDDCLLQVARG